MNFRIVQELVFCVVTLILSLATAAIAQGPAAEAASQSPASSPTTTPSAAWHVGVTPYLWFAGMHGTFGALGREASVRASFGDLISHFDIGLMGEVEARKKRFLLTTDIMWMRLSDQKGLPLDEVGIQSIDAKATEFLLTPGVGYRILDKEKIKVDAWAGFRYWHLGQTLQLKPSIFGGISQSQNWVDALGGARIHIPLSQKATVTIGGDAGGGGANSDYQVAGLLGYKVAKKVMLQAGWRYLDVNYRNSRSFIYDTATSGVLFGATIILK